MDDLVRWLGLLFLGTAVYASEPDFGDWKKKSNHFCQGYYVPPVSPSTPINDDVDFDAAEIQYLHPNRILFKKGMKVSYRGGFLSADEAEVRMRDREWKEVAYLSAHQHVRFYHPMTQVFSEKAEIDFEKQSFFMSDAHYHLYPLHARGQAQRFTLNMDQGLLLENTSYTTCPPGDDTWSFYARQLSVDAQRQHLKLEKSWLYFRKWPIFYAPYLDISLNKARQTGFLFPSLRQDNTSGYQLFTPYYVNLAPHYDLLLTPKWYQHRGLGLDGHFRYLNPYGRSDLQWQSLWSDRKYQHFQTTHQQNHPDILNNDDPRLQRLKGHHRWLVQTTHHYRWAPYWKTEANLLWLSDHNYYVDFSEALAQQSTEKIAQTAQIAYEPPNWKAHFSLENYETLHAYLGPERSETYRKMPHMSWQRRTPYRLMPGLLLDGQVQIDYFTQPRNQRTQLRPTEGWRWHASPSLSYPWHYRSLEITPKVSGLWTEYFLKKSSTLSNTYRTRFLPQYELDVRGSYPYWIYFGTPLVAILEPHLQYLYIPYRAQNHLPRFDTGLVTLNSSTLFRTNRFSGLDRIGDAHQITWSLLTQIHHHGWIPQTTARLAQIFYLDERHVSKCDQTVNPSCLAQENPFYRDRYSGFLGELKTYLTSDLHVESQFQWHPREQRWISYSNHLHFHKKNRILNLGQYFLKNDPDRSTATQAIPLRQWYLSTYWPLTDHWRLLGKWQYNVAEHFSIDMFSGFEYDNCCMTAQWIAGRTHMPTHNYRPVDDNILPRWRTWLSFQLMFKGLSSVSFQNTEHRLKEAIEGYPQLAHRIYD